MNPMPPCYDCKNRTIECHGTCTEYKQWAEWNKKVRCERQEKEREERWRLEK